MDKPDAAIVRLEGLSRRFGEVTALDRVSFTVAAGEFFGLIGPNGAGKSTLMKILTTLLPPSSGRAEVAGYDVARRPAEVRRRIGYVPQLPSADGELTGYENLLLAARLYLIPARERTDRIAGALEMMGLADVGHRTVAGYSGGMMRRLEIALSTLHHPRIVFLDEPTVGLDPAGRAVVWDSLRQLRKQIGATVVMSTHYMDEVEHLCSRVAFVNRGRIAAIGAPSELRAKAGPGSTLDDVFLKLVGEGGAAR